MSWGEVSSFSLINKQESRKFVRSKPQQQGCQVGQHPGNERKNGRKHAKKKGGGEERGGGETTVWVVIRHQWSEAFGGH